jgi:hypothetical protein
MTNKSMFDILSKFDNAGKTPVNESATPARRSSGAGDPAMFDILSKFNDVTTEAGPANYPSYPTGNNSADALDTGNAASGLINRDFDMDKQQAQDEYDDLMARQQLVRPDPNMPDASVAMSKDVEQAADQALDKANKIQQTYGLEKQSPTTPKQELDMELFNDVNEDENDMPASDEEASMAGDQAEYIKYAIDEIKDSIEAGNSFPEWFQNKLSGVYTTLKDLHAYMEGDKRNDADDVEVVMSLEDVVSKDKAKGADVVGKKTAVDDVVKELAKSYADFVAQVEEEKDDMSFFKKGK